MDVVLPWLAVAGLGVLHGLNPASGWMFAAAWRARGTSPVPRALLGVGLGHGVSIVLLVGALAQGVVLSGAGAQALAGALLLALAVHRCLARRARPEACAHQAARDPVGEGVPGRDAPGRDVLGIGAWSCLMGVAHGAGLMLVPALLPLCMSASSMGPLRQITASGSLMLMSIAVAVHLLAMLATTGVIAAAVRRGVQRHSAVWGPAAMRYLWTCTLMVAGVALIVLR